MKTKKASLILIAILLVLLLILAGGALDSVRRGSGFLFIPSFTPSATNTPTATDTPTATETFTATMTATETSTATYTATATFTLTPSPSATFTPAPTDTITPLPTLDETALVESIYAEVTAAVENFRLLQTPSATPPVPNEDLYTGLRMVSPYKNIELYFVKTDYEQNQHGFWITWNEITNREYAECVIAGYCSGPQSGDVAGEAYYSAESYADYPVVNVTRGQAAAWCSWIGMQLISAEDWKIASEVIADAELNIASAGPRAEDNQYSNLIGNVWEWTTDEDDTGFSMIAGGSWKTAAQDIRAGRFGRMAPNRYAEDIGFRCVMYVNMP